MNKSEKRQLASKYVSTQQSTICLLHSKVQEDLSRKFENMWLNVCSAKCEKLVYVSYVVLMSEMNENNKLCSLRVANIFNPLLF